MSAPNLDEKAQRNLALLLQNPPVAQKPSASAPQPEISSAPVIDRMRKSSPQKSKTIQTAFDEEKDFFPGSASGKLDPALIFQDRSRSGILNPRPQGEPAVKKEDPKIPVNDIPLVISLAPYAMIVGKGLMAAVIAYGVYYTFRETLPIGHVMRMISAFCDRSSPTQQSQSEQQQPQQQQSASRS